MGSAASAGWFFAPSWSPAARTSRWSASTISGRSRPMLTSFATTRSTASSRARSRSTATRIDVGQGPMKVTAVKNPAELPWKELEGRYRARMHRHLHLEGEGVGSSPGRCQARPDLGSGRRRRPDRRLRRQRRQADQGRHHRLECVLHHQLPRAGRLRAQQRRRHRARLHDHDPFLHRRPADARHAAQGSLPRPRRRPRIRSRPRPALPRRSGSSFPN